MKKVTLHLEPEDAKKLARLLGTVSQSSIKAALETSVTPPYDGEQYDLFNVAVKVHEELSSHE